LSDKINQGKFAAAQYMISSDQFLLRVPPHARHLFERWDVCELVGFAKGERAQLLIAFRECGYKWSRTSGCFVEIDRAVLQERFPNGL
jgi:hypothetical protein